MSTIEARVISAVQSRCMESLGACVAGRVHPRQLAFALPHAESLTRDNFLEGPANAAGLALIDAWPEWPSRTMLLAGPEGSGKSHLAAIWAEARRRAFHHRACADSAAECTGRARDRRAGGGGFEAASVRRARAVSPAQSRARGSGLCADHRARAAFGIRDRIARPALTAARAARGVAARTRRPTVPRADRQILRGSPAGGGREPSSAISRPGSSGPMPRRGRRSNFWTARRFALAGP